MDKIQSRCVPHYIKFESKTCVPCKKLDKILKILEVDNLVQHVDIDNMDECGFSLDLFEIKSVPTLVKLDNCSAEDFIKLVGLKTLSEYKEFFGLE